MNVIFLIQTYVVVFLCLFFVIFSSVKHKMFLVVFLVFFIEVCERLQVIWTSVLLVSLMYYYNNVYLY